MAKANIESRIQNGVEVYDVGKSQLWEWAHWAAAGAGNAQAWHGVPQTVAVEAESLAKGSYVVMELQFSGRVQDVAEMICLQDATFFVKVTAKASARSLKEAVELAGLYKISKPMTTCYPSYIGSVNNLVEVWHIVDDAELWQGWEYGVAQSHIAQGWDTDYHLYENRRCILDCSQRLPKVLYCIYVTCEDGESVYSVDYYDDSDKFYVALDLAIGLHRCDLYNVDTFFAYELGITVVNDDDLDEGLADTLPVSVFYLRLPSNEQ